MEVSLTSCKLGLSAESDEVRVLQASAVKQANICSWFQVGNIMCSLPKAQGVAAFLLPIAALANAAHIAMTHLTAVQVQPRKEGAN